MKSFLGFVLAIVLTAICSPAVLADDGWVPLSKEEISAVDIASGGWADVWVDRHESLGGRPFIHGFLTEPAFLCRSIRTDFWYSDSNSWATVDADLALTRRLAVRAQLPFAFDLNDESGFGDSSLALTGLLFENPRLLFAQSLEVGIPTGNADRGLGTDDWSFSTSSHVWFDTCWEQVTLQGQVGFSYVPDLNDWSFDWGVTVAKSFDCFPVYALAEISGSTPIDSDGETTGLWLLGGGFNITDRISGRAGFTYSFDDEPGFVLGFSFDL